MTYQADPERSAAIPVTVPGQDLILARNRDLVVAVTGVRAYPQAVMFQLIVKTRFAEGEDPNLVFELPHLLRPGDFEFGADLLDAAGQWQPVKPRFAGGGGGTGAGPDVIGSSEFKWWVPFSDEDRGLRLRCIWEGRGVPESVAELDMDAVTAAARASGPAWAD